jgi:chromosomal replication initiator protein
MQSLNASDVSALEKIDSHLQEIVTPQQYRTWFQTLKLVNVSEEKILFSVPNDFIREWISCYYPEVLEKVLLRVFGRPCKFAISSETTASMNRDPGIASQVEESSTVAPALARDAEDPATLNSYPSQTVDDTSPISKRSDRFACKSDIILNPNYIFDNFIVGPGNQLASAAAQAVADSSSQKYNPLFIHGSVGLGKTHLLQAICHRRLRNNPGIKILYLSCETFINQFISAIEKGDIWQFRNKYRHIDILLIDDIYLIANKERTQEEFFHTFNSLYNAGKQIVLSSDSHPSEIPTLEDRLVSRFKWGLVAQIESPDFETRYAILKAKARAMGHEVPDDVLKFLAEAVDTNIRELEGAITKVIGFSVLMETPLDITLAQAATRDVIKKPASYITIDDIVRAVTKKFGVRLSDLQSKKRNHSIVLPRQICMYVAKKRTSLSLQEIGGFFGGRDHTTVINAVEKIKNTMKKDETLSNIVNEILDQLTN